MNIHAARNLFLIHARSFLDAHTESLCGVITYVNAWKIVSERVEIIYVVLCKVPSLNHDVKVSARLSLEKKSILIPMCRKRGRW